MGYLVIYNIAQLTFSAIIPSLLLWTSLCRTRLLMVSRACSVLSCPVSLALVSSLASSPFPPSLWLPAYSSRLSPWSAFLVKLHMAPPWQVVGCFLSVFLLQRFSCCLVRTYFLLPPDCRLLEQDWVLLSLYPRCVAWAWHTCCQIEFFNLVPFLLKLGGKIKFTADINYNFL